MIGLPAAAIAPLIRAALQDDRYVPRAAERLGIGEHSVRRTLRGVLSGRTTHLSLDLADRLAVTLGLHIDLIWLDQEAG